MSEHTAWLSLGSNLGDRLYNLQQAELLINLHAGKIIRKSSVYKTAPWGNRDQNEFYNQVIAILTTSNPGQLLDTLLRIEQKMGRTREVHWGPRIIDLDILFFDNIIVQKENLVIPHPQLQERNFILAPMAEVAGDFTHPVFNKTIDQLLAVSPDSLSVVRLDLKND